MLIHFEHGHAFPSVLVHQGAQRYLSRNERNKSHFGHSHSSSWFSVYLVITLLVIRLRMTQDYTKAYRSTYRNPWRPQVLGINTLFIWESLMTYTMHILIVWSVQYMFS